MQKAAALAVLGLALAPAHATLIYGTNLIDNSGAEAGPSDANGSPVASIPSWTSGTSGMTVVPYANTAGFPVPTDPGPANRGLQFFAGGNDALSSITQTVSIADGATAIDTGTIAYAISAYLGGYSTQDDYATFSITFEDASNAILGTNTLGPVTPADRNNQTGLLPRAANGTIPTGTRSLLFTLQATRLEGTANDGYADNLSFIATATTTQPSAPIPEPASLALLGLGLLGLRLTRRQG